ncbi:MAG: hypothetical protein ABFS02_00770 [Pseudomonadota bacterium]
MNTLRYLVFALMGSISAVFFSQSVLAVEAGAMNGLTARLTIKVKGYETTETVDTIPEPDQNLVSLDTTKKQSRRLSNNCYLRFEYLPAPQPVGGFLYAQGIYNVWTACSVDGSWEVTLQDQIVFYEQADFSAVSFFGIISLIDLTSTTGEVEQIYSAGAALAKPTKNGRKISFLAGRGFVAIKDSDAHFIDGTTKVIAKTTPWNRFPDGLDDAFVGAMGS